MGKWPDSLRVQSGSSGRLGGIHQGHRRYCNQQSSTVRTCQPGGGYWKQMKALSRYIANCDSRSRARCRRAEGAAALGGGAEQLLGCWVLHCSLLTGGPRCVEALLQRVLG